MRGRERERGVQSIRQAEGREFLQDWLRPPGIRSRQGVQGDALVNSQPMRRSLMQLRQSQVRLRPWVSHTGVPTQDKVLWGRTLPGKDILSGLGRRRPAIKVPLSSTRTILSHMGSRCWVFRWVSGEYQAAQRQPSDPAPIPWGYLCSGEINPFGITCRTASAAPAAAGCSQPRT